MNRVVLGIDPGLSVTGFGVVTQNQGGRGARLLECGFFSFSSQKPLAQRVSEFHDQVALQITKWSVTDLAIETPFLGKNTQTFLKLGYLRGILLLLAHKNELRLHEYSPSEVKLQLVGSGAADKQQVAYMIGKFFPQLPPPSKEDVTDAMAVAVCGLWAPRIQLPPK